MIPEEEEIPYTGTEVDIPITHRYNTRLRTQNIRPITTFNNTLVVFPMEKKKTKHHQGADYYIRVYTIKYAITVEPTANHIHCETTGKYWVTDI